MQVFTGRERSDLHELASGIGDAVWPEYNRHGNVLNRYWGRMQDEFPDFQFVLWDDGELLLQGHSLPLRWDGTLDDLPSGIDEAAERAFSGEEPNTQRAMAIEIDPEHQGRGLSAEAIRAMGAIGAAHGFGSLIAPVRPSWKERYPLAPIEEYSQWRRGNGELFDPWLRVHERLGGEVLRPEPRSLLIEAPVEDWESWTEMQFPRDGEYWFPRCLAPLHVRDGVGTYFEPNVWMRHRV